MITNQICGVIISFCLDNNYNILNYLILRHFKEYLNDGLCYYKTKTYKQAHKHTNANA